MVPVYHAAHTYHKDILDIFQNFNANIHFYIYGTFSNNYLSFILIIHIYFFDVGLQ